MENDKTSNRRNRDLQEILVTSDNSGQLGNIFFWDPKNGSQLAAYKGGTTAPNTLCYNVGSTFLLSANPNKPLLKSDIFLLRAGPKEISNFKRVQLVTFIT